MAHTIHVDVVSAEERIFAGEAEFVVLPGVMGELGIYPRHAPLLTQIKPGAVRIKLPGKDEEELVFVQGGFLEVQPTRVTVLADTAVRARDLDEKVRARCETGGRGSDAEQDVEGRDRHRRSGARHCRRADRGNPEAAPPRVTPPRAPCPPRGGRGYPFLAPSPMRGSGGADLAAAKAPGTRSTPRLAAAKPAPNPVAVSLPPNNETVLFSPLIHERLHQSHL